MSIVGRIISGILVFIQLVIGGYIVIFSLNPDAYKPISDAIFGPDTPMMGSTFLDVLMSWPFAIIIIALFLVSLIKEFLKWKPIRLVLINLAFLAFEVVWGGYLYYMLWILPVQYMEPV